MGQKAFEPSDEQRRFVETAAAAGIPQADIAQAIGISKNTLPKYFRDEIDNGVTKANVRVAGALFKMAISGDCPAATIFWCKTRLGWREKEQAQAASEESTPRQIEWRKPETPSRS
jgi:DNA-binding XRE family transcriptional regulator